MLSRRNFVTLVIVTYLVSSIFFFAFKEPQTEKDHCIYGQTCIRFCCNDVDLCKVKIIQKTFNASGIPSLKEQEEKDYQILHGEPHCKTLVPFGAEREWEFSEVKPFD